MILRTLYVDFIKYIRKIKDKSFICFITKCYMLYVFYYLCKILLTSFLAY